MLILVVKLQETKAAEISLLLKELYRALKELKRLLNKRKMRLSQKLNLNQVSVPCQTRIVMIVMTPLGGAKRPQKEEQGTLRKKDASEQMLIDS